MKRISISIFISIIISITSFGQCYDFAKDVVKNQIPPYIHDGNYNATMLTEGQEAEFFKTFYAGQKYRIIISGDENIPTPEYKILNKLREVVFDNVKDGNGASWDFVLEDSQQLIISITIPRSEQSTIKSNKGCVAIMLGLMYE